MMKRQQGRASRSLGRRVDRELEKFIHRVMTNEGLEETISQAVQKALVELLSRYLAWGAVAVVLLLSLHSVLLVLLLKSDFPNFREAAISTPGNRLSRSFTEF
jgi:hypothetical protein